MTRTAIVSGAAQGVGQAITDTLRRDGVDRFLLLDLAEGPLIDQAEKLRSTGAIVEAVTLDLSDIDKVMQVVSTKIAEMGQIDILINAAGTTARGGIENTTPDLFDFIYNVNVRAPFFLMQMAIGAMKKGGVIVNICSMLAYGGPPFLLAYSSSKAALVALTKGTANAVKRDGIRVFGINLGWTWTPGEQITQTQTHGLSENWVDEIGKTQPFGRLLMPEDPAGLVSFLVSASARMMTGAIIDLDQFVAGTVEDNPGSA